jgi:hypothetical protein
MDAIIYEKGFVPNFTLGMRGRNQEDEVTYLKAQTTIAFNNTSSLASI